MYKLTALAATALVFGLAGQALAGSTLTAKQIRNLAPGSYDVDLMETISMTVRLLPGGKILGQAGGEKDKGRWNVAGNKLCIKWSTWLEGKHRCSTLETAAGELRGDGFTFKKI